MFLNTIIFENSYILKNTFHLFQLNREYFFFVFISAMFLNYNYTLVNSMEMIVSRVQSWFSNISYSKRVN